MSTKRCRSRQVCFTLNNYTDTEVEELKSCYPLKFEYLCFGKEVSETGTPHLQGYARIVGGKQVDWTVVHKWPGCARLALSNPAGNAKQNRVYCAKGEQTHTEYEEYHPRKTPTQKPWNFDDPDWNHGPNYGLNADFLEYGLIVTEPGKRNDLREVVEKIIDNPSVEIDTSDLQTATCYARYANNLERIRIKEISKTLQHYDEKFVVYIHGKTGVGKTHGVEHFTNAIFGSYKSDKLWKSGLSKNKQIMFDGYSSQPVALFDDFTPGQISFKQLLTIMNRGPTPVHVLYNQVLFNPQVIIITASRSVDELFAQRLEYDEGGLEQLHRRISIEISGNTTAQDIAGQIAESYGKHLKKRKPCADFDESAIKIQKIFEDAQIEKISKPSLVRQKNYQNLDDYFKK